MNKVRNWPDNPAGKKFYLIGIKGTGMTALCELLTTAGAIVTGSDVDEEFYTDEVLQGMNIPYCNGFSLSNLPDEIDYAVRSAAYPETHEEVAEVIRRDIPLLTYTEALGRFSSLFESCGIAGVHGKTTTTALTGSLVKSLDLPVSVLVGSAVPEWGNRSTFSNGNRFFIAETCEYRRHFLDFEPSCILITSIEPDHLDYFEDYNDIFSAFTAYIDRIPERGTLVFCADDEGAFEAAEWTKKNRPDIKCIPYGFSAEGRFGISSYQQGEGNQTFCLNGFNESFELKLPGRHLVQNSAGALALAIRHLEQENREVTEDDLCQMKAALTGFRSTRRRCEIVGEVGGILILDDYAHHPTAVEKTLEGFKAFYPGRRLIVDFMSHTYSRTAGLLKEFASSFSSADVLILHKIYASAREKYSGNVSGKTLFEEAQKQHHQAIYFDEPEQAVPWCLEELEAGDILLTMGAGNNWQMGREVLNALKAKHQESL